jgi:hypothetical protein
MNHTNRKLLAGDDAIVVAALHGGVALAPDQVLVNFGQLPAGGDLISPEMVDEAHLANRKSLIVALLGLLSQHLDIPDEYWAAAVRSVFPEKFQVVNQQAFAYGRSLAVK